MELRNGGVGAVYAEKSTLGPPEIVMELTLNELSV